MRDWQSFCDSGLLQTTIVKLWNLMTTAIKPQHNSIVDADVVACACDSATLAWKSHMEEALSV